MQSSPSSSQGSTQLSTGPIVIHHLSDLHYRHDTDHKDDVLLQYNRYMDRLAKDSPDYPHVVVFSGDLSATGHPDDLRTIADKFPYIFTKWDGELNKHVFVVPGPNDLGWNGTTPSFVPFQRAFANYGLPHIDPVLPQNPKYDPKKNKPPAATLPSVPPPTSALYRGPQDAYAVYLLDTCASLALLFQDPNKLTMKDLKSLPDRLKDQLERYLRFTNGVELGPPQKDHREAFLQLLEETLLSFDLGAVRASEITLFKAEMQKYAPTSDPLKILVSHHPLMVRQQKHLFTSLGKALAGYQEFVQEAHKFGFQLGLHGNLHKPQILTDLSLQAGSGAPLALRQIGAASMGIDHAFNKITATRNQPTPENPLPGWQFKVETVDVRQTPPQSVFSLQILDPKDDQANVMGAKRAEANLDTRIRFERGLSSIMHRFFDAQAKGDNNDLPFGAFDDVEEIIKTVIFAGIPVKTGFVQKFEQPRAGLTPAQALARNPAVDMDYHLDYRYILEDPDNLLKFDYPATVAAWSLIIGRELWYVPPPSGAISLPTIPATLPTLLSADVLDDGDRTWLAASQKDTFVRRLADERVRRMKVPLPPPSVSGSSMALTALQTRLTQIRDGVSGKPLKMEDIFDDAFNRADQPPFLAVPVPLRPGDFPLQLPTNQVWEEVGVLNITLILPKEDKTTGPESLPPVLAAKAFTEERIGMLKTISDLMYLMLTSAARQGKPDATWKQHPQP